MGGGYGWGVELSNFSIQQQSRSTSLTSFKAGNITCEEHSLCYVTYLKSLKSIEGTEIELSSPNSQFLVDPPENTPFLLVHLGKVFC